MCFQSINCFKQFFSCREISSATKEILLFKCRIFIRKLNWNHNLRHLILVCIFHLVDLLLVDQNFLFKIGEKFFARTRMLIVFINYFHVSSLYSMMELLVLERFRPEFAPCFKVMFVFLIHQSFLRIQENSFHVSIVLRCLSNWIICCNPSQIFNIKAIDWNFLFRIFVFFLLIFQILK